MKSVQSRNGALSCADFCRTLDRERARADRHDREFSILLLDGDALSNPDDADDLINVIVARIRSTDEIGWFDKPRIVLLLPYTSSSGAIKLADDIERLVAPRSPIFTVYTYPGRPLPDDLLTSGPLGSGITEADERRPVTESTEVLETARCPLPVWKRVIDVVVSAASLLMLSPIFAIVAATIAVVSPGPVLLGQKRIGYKGKPFKIWKFRTMRTDADTTVHQEHLKKLMTGDVPLTKLDLKGDPRIIPLGNIIRRCYLDELPQLINVLRGEMSLVGPRPCLAFELSQYRPWQRIRCDAVPGMTGLWQVSGKNKTTFKEMIRLDIAYVRGMSLGLDIRILLRTIPTILRELIEAILNRRTAVLNRPDQNELVLTGDGSEGGQRSEAIRRSIL